MQFSVFVRRIHYRLTGACRWYMPDDRGVCRVCRSVGVKKDIKNIQCVHTKHGVFRMDINQLKDGKCEPGWYCIRPGVRVRSRRSRQAGARAPMRAGAQKDHETSKLLENAAMMQFLVFSPEGKLITDEEWVARFGEHKPRCLTAVGDVIVSTVYLGLNYQFSPDGPPLFYETMIFGGRRDRYTVRYSSREEAITGHFDQVRATFGDDFFARAVV